MKEDKNVQERKLCLPEPPLFRTYYTAKQDAVSWLKEACCLEFLLICMLNCNHSFTVNIKFYDILIFQVNIYNAKWFWRL